MTNEMRPQTRAHLPQLIHGKGLEILIMATLPTLKRKKQKMWTGGSLIKISLETCLTRENFRGYLGKLISNKSMNHTTVNNRKCLHLPEYETNHDDSNNNDDSISYDGTINHDVILIF